MLDLLMQLEYKFQSTHKGHLAVALGHPTRLYTNGEKKKKAVSNMNKFLNGYGIAVVKCIKHRH